MSKKRSSKSAKYFWNLGSLFKVENNTVFDLDTESWTWRRSNFSKEDIEAGVPVSMKDLPPTLLLWLWAKLLSKEAEKDFWETKKISGENNFDFLASSITNNFITLK